MYGFVPIITAQEITVAMSLFGSVAMPHNMYLQSSTCMKKGLEKLDNKAKHRTIKYFRIETFGVVMFAFIINLAIIGSFATYHCKKLENHFDFIKAALLLQANIGYIAFVLYAIGLFASGMSATGTGGLTGQYVMNSYIQSETLIKYPLIRCIITRCIAIVPCLIIVWWAEMDAAQQVLNIVQSIELPFV